MNFLKRAFFNMRYKKVYNIILIVLFTVLATLVLSGFAINDASSQACTQVRRELGGAVTMRNADVGRDITLQGAKKAAALKYVQSENFIDQSKAYAYDFKAIGDPLAGFRGKIKKPEADIIAEGVTRTDKLSAFSSGTEKLLSGRGLANDDTGSSNAVIEEALANQDNLKVGGKLTLLSTVGQKPAIVFTIVGIYRDTSQNTSSAGPLYNNGNQIYIPYGAAQRLCGSDDKLNYAVFYMNDPINIDSFKSEAAAQLGSGYTLDAQDASYRRMSGSLQSLAFISHAMVVGIIIIGVVIMSLIVMLSLKDRKYEIGVLLSIGEKKVKIISQLAVEILVPVIIAFSISIAAGTVVAQQIGNVMLGTGKQVQSGIEAVSESTIKDYATGKTLPTQQKIAVTITSREILLLYAMGIMTALLSTATPIVFVLRYNPKKILSEAE